MTAAAAAGDYCDVLTASDAAAAAAVAADGSGGGRAGCVSWAIIIAFFHSPHTV